MKLSTYVRVATFIKILLPDVLVAGGSVTARYGQYKLVAPESERVHPVIHDDQEVLLKDYNDDMFSERQRPNPVAFTHGEAADVQDETQGLKSYEAKTEILSGVSEAAKSTKELRELFQAEEIYRLHQQDPIPEELVGNQEQLESTVEEQRLKLKKVGMRQTPVWEKSPDSHQGQNVQIASIEGVQKPQKLHYPLREDFTSDEQFQDYSQISIAREVERQCSLALRQVSSMCRCSQVVNPKWTARTERETSSSSADDIPEKKIKLLNPHSKINPNSRARGSKREVDTLRTSHGVSLNLDSIFLKQFIPSKRPRRNNRREVERNAQLEIEEPNRVSLRLDCSCNGDQVLELAGISALPIAVHQLHVSDCRGGEVALAPSLTASDSSLRHLTLTNIKNLTLGGGALDMDLQKDGQNTQFLMELRNIGLLRISRGAIRLSGSNCNSSFVWKNVILKSLPSFAITASNLVNFTLNGILIEGAIETSSVNLESSGTYLILDEVDAKEGIRSNWISGDLAGLSITRSRLNLAPGAFQQVSFSQSNPNVIIRNNIFGDQHWSSSVLYPSLTSGVFDFTFKDDSALLNISKNTAQCADTNLEWLYEHKKSVILHWLRCGLLKTLSCHDNDQQPLSQPSCRFEEIIPAIPAEMTTAIGAIMKGTGQTPATEIATSNENRESKDYAAANTRGADVLLLYPSDLHSTSNIYSAGSEYSMIFPDLTNPNRDLVDEIQSFKKQQPTNHSDDIHSHPGHTDVHHQKRNTGNVGLDRQYRQRAEDEDFGLDMHRKAEPVWRQSSVVALERVSLPQGRQETASSSSAGTVISQIGLFTIVLLVLHLFHEKSKT